MREGFLIVAAIIGIDRKIAMVFSGAFGFEASHQAVLVSLESKRRIGFFLLLGRDREGKAPFWQEQPCAGKAVVEAKLQKKHPFDRIAAEQGRHPDSSGHGKEKRWFPRLPWHGFLHVGPEWIG
ncbi:hypothetical protein [uncultured Cohaesibacter sp.]|uniref:hypothetical protein n=1 Tax=uncultured Cohaesibacter sp. TaxID=1002546 RepID=UPI0029310E6B|nr:hypothetical protein [uncultured Cohaesibacter sp.]